MAVNSDKEIQQLKKRLRELAEKSYRQGIYTFSNFLGLSEQDIFWEMEKELQFAGYKLWGGQEDADRRMLRFGSEKEFGYEEEFPVACIHMKPLLVKFADDFSHRDFLGALMNLGIDRGTIGDIKVAQKEGYLFCQTSIAPFICEHLEKVRHTNIRCRIVEDAGDIPREEPEPEQIQVTSERIDGVVSKVYNMSRSESMNMFRDRKVYVDGRLNENNSRILKPGEAVNVRGYGKFIYSGIKYETKKGKLCLEVRVFR